MSPVLAPTLSPTLLFLLLKPDLKELQRQAAYRQNLQMDSKWDLSQLEPRFSSWFQVLDAIRCLKTPLGCSPRLDFNNDTRVVEPSTGLDSGLDPALRPCVSSSGALCTGRCVERRLKPVWSHKSPSKRSRNEAFTLRTATPMAY